MADQSCEYHPVNDENSENENVLVAEDFTDAKDSSKASAGGWATAIPIIAFQTGERLAYYTVSANIITYMTDVLRISTASAAVNANVWSGSLCILTVLGAFVSDSVLGFYWTVFYSSLIYLTGLILLAFSALLPSCVSPLCPEKSGKCPDTKGLKLGWFFVSFYMVALGAGSQQSCLEALGAFQFDDRDPKQAKQKSSFFNWWAFVGSTCSVISVSIFVYVQENISWGLGFGIPTIIMATMFCFYLLKSPAYRDSVPKPSAYTHLVRVVIAAFRNRKTSIASSVNQEDNGVAAPLQSKHRRFLKIRAMVGDEESAKWAMSSNEEAEEGKLLLRLVPIWLSALMYGAIVDQSSQLFVKQGKAMNRKIGSSFEIPSAALQSFGAITISVLVPLYDTIFVPLVSKVTGHVRGVTILQRIGIGLVTSNLCMIAAALVEMRRLHLVKELNLENEAGAVVPMSICWLIPQYIFLGSSFVFAWVGLQEFFFEQMPQTLKSLGLAVMMSAMGTGGLLGGFLVSIMDKASRMDGHYSWFDNNMNRAHFDYFYCVIAALSAIFLCVYTVAARRFLPAQVKTVIGKQRNGWE